jgi:gamma-glutamylcyclotransferase (GGCT)/AIG2-like uncharacterized protein YtfP
MRPALADFRRPLDQADMIPAAAAGRQALFFFGTLMDLDVLTYVLERPVDLDDLRPAILTGYHRVAIEAASYPTLRMQAGARVRGRLLRRASRRDVARVNHFESGEYRAELHSVATDDGAEHSAWLYLGLDHLACTDETWSLENWQRWHKPGFFSACDGWMADFAALD